jgi:hypothetical protein
MGPAIAPAAQYQLAAGRHTVSQSGGQRMLRGKNTTVEQTRPSSAVMRAIFMSVLCLAATSAIIGISPIKVAQAAISGNRTDAEYVAMGDSYSSGEGIDPFLLGTEVESASGQGCHRSVKGYPSLVATDLTGVRVPYN